jgi:hypothetical protein
MKKVHLIEWGIIVIGLIFAYSAFEALFAALVSLVYSPFELDAEILWIFIFPIIYTIFFVLLVKNAGKIAGMFQPIEDDSPPLPIKIGKRALLQVVLIAISFSILVHGLADVAIYLIKSFKDAVGKNYYSTQLENGSVGKYQFYAALARSVFAFLIVYFSKYICELFFRKNEKDELILETPESTIDNSQNV